MSALISHGVLHAAVGGERGKLNSIWILTAIIPRFAVPDSRITSAVRTIFDKGGKYTAFTTPYSGLHEVILPTHAKGRAYAENTKFGMYRWHITDPVRFDSKLKVTVQDLGWGDKTYRKQSSDIATVAYWYQTEPHAKFPPLPPVELLKNEESVSSKK